MVRCRHDVWRKTDRSESDQKQVQFHRLTKQHWMLDQSFAEAHQESMYRNWIHLGNTDGSQHKRLSHCSMTTRNCEWTHPEDSESSKRESAEKRTDFVELGDFLAPTQDGLFDQSRILLARRNSRCIRMPRIFKRAGGPTAANRLKVRDVSPLGMDHLLRRIYRLSRSSGTMTVICTNCLVYFLLGKRISKWREILSIVPDCWLRCEIRSSLLADHI